MAEDEWEKKIELFNRTVDALTLGFTEPIRFDYKIPGPHKIIKSVDFAMDKLFAKKYPQFNLKFHEFFDGPSHSPYLQRMAEFEERVNEGLIRCLWGSQNDDPYIHRALGDEYRFGREWFLGDGNLFRFRPDGRERAETLVEEYFNEKEKENFERLYKHIREYISERP
ncbi:hypothetical protein GOV03_01810 [Candidatus Woesearchaeota archaeon]|nr:hypothetical protein [Candidatus Woesearchaeota archaeon]